MEYDPALRPTVVEIGVLERQMGVPGVVVAVESTPPVLRYEWPCGCSALGVGGPKCLATRCGRHPR